jgi:hypothetical protein
MVVRYAGANSTLQFNQTVKLFLYSPLVLISAC